jgi:hypothetical protein
MVYLLIAWWIFPWRAVITRCYIDLLDLLEVGFPSPKLPEASLHIPGFLTGGSRKVMGRLWECYGNGGLIGSFLRAFGFIARRRAGCCWRTKQIRFSGIARDCCRLISSCATKCLAWRMDARCLRISGGLVVEE